MTSLWFIINVTQLTTQTLVMYGFHALAGLHNCLLREHTSQCPCPCMFYLSKLAI